MSTFTRRFGYPRVFANAVKAAKVLGLEVVSVTALGRWRTLQPINGEYVDYEGPFRVKAGVGPAFIRDDGTEIFMLDETSMVGVEFKAEGE